MVYAATGVLYLSAGLVVPYPWVYGFWVAWAAGAVGAVFVFSLRRGWTVAVSVGAVVVWFIAVQAGSSLFGWSA